jgi:hypothetical protein
MGSTRILLTKSLVFTDRERVDWVFEDLKIGRQRHRSERYRFTVETID